MLYILKVPKVDKHFHLLVETKGKYSLDELKGKLYQSNINEDLKDDIDFITEMCVERDYMKEFFIKNGFKIIELD